MRRAEITESVLIVVALASLWPWLAGYRPAWYTPWLLLMLAAMIGVAVRRLKRIRAAAEEAKRKRDEAKRSGRPPWLTS